MKYGRVRWSCSDTYLEVHSMWLSGVWLLRNSIKQAFMHLTVEPQGFRSIYICHRYSYWSECSGDNPRCCNDVRVDTESCAVMLVP